MMREEYPVRARLAAPRLEHRPVARRVGLVVLATDHTTECDFQRLVAGQGIGVYANRVPFTNPVTPENLRAMQPALTRGAADILPGEALDAICYSCTSASVAIGDGAVEAAIAAAKPNVPVVTPPAAATRGLRALGARNLSILAPYDEETSRAIARYFGERGFEIDMLSFMGLTDDREMARIEPASIVESAVSAMAPGSDALFISCTALRAASVVPAIERATGRPVVTSNLATAWNCLHLCAFDEPQPALGRLMTLALPAA